METITTTSWRALTVLFFALGFQLSFGQVVYVDQDATGTGDGASWANAMTDLQGAIDAATSVATNSNPVQVWVKADTYFPTSTTTQTIYFEIKNNVEMYGGFEGTETTLSQRDFDRFETILSGNIGSKSDSTDNSDRILVASNDISNSALIDGFSISGAHINNAGAAVAMNGTAAQLTINNCKLFGNYGSLGSAISSFYTSNAQSVLNVYNSTFYHNGAINTGSSAIYTSNALNVANCVFYGNKSSIGGAITGYNGSVTVANSTFAGNAVGGGGGSGIATQDVSLLSIRNNIFWDNSGSSYYTTYGSVGSFALSNNLVNSDPLFVDYANKDFGIGWCSPAVDIGNNSAISLAEDIAGNNRVFGSSVDAGAFENQAPPVVINSIGLGAPSCNGDSNGEINVAASGGSGASIHYSIDGVNFSANAVFSGISAGNYTITVLDTGTGCTLSENGTVTEPSNFSVTASSTDIACNGDNNGTIAGTVSGASGPYVVSLNGNAATGQFTSDFTIENLTPGNYGLTIVDGNGCDYTHPSSFVIEQPDAITASVSIGDVLCNGEPTGSFTVNASGGTPPLYYTIEGLNSNYLTSPIFENLMAGSYTLTVIDSKLCYEEFSVMISEPTELTVNVSSTTNPTCDGQPDGSILVSGSGGTPSLFYSIDGVNFVATSTFSDLAAGTYTITVEDENGCRAEVSETIENQINLTLNTVSTLDVSCNGETDGAFEVSLSGGTAERFSIPNVAPQSSGLFENLAAGSYEVTGQDTNGCTTTMTIDILEPDVLTLSVNQSGAGFSLTASGGTAPYEYSLDGTTFQTSPNFQNLDGGLYTFTAKDANGCSVESTEFNVVLGTIKNQLRIYPNPVANVLKVEGVDFDRLTVYDLSGNELMSTRDREVMLRNFKNGVYIVRLHDKLGNELAIRKILKY